MAKSKERLLARNLRKKGKSIKEIARLLHVSVSSVSVWCRDIDLTKEQIKNLTKRVIDASFEKRMEYTQKIKRQTDKKIKKLKEKGVKEINKLSKREIFLIGVALYWGEGFKKDHQVGLATSDANIAKFFILWLNKCFHISYKDLILRVTANVSYKDKVRQIEKYWAKELNIPISNFSKPFFQKTKWKKEYENKDEYHAVIRIKVRRSINLLRKIYGYIEGVALNVKS